MAHGWTHRLASLVAVHLNGPTGVSAAVAADLAAQARRRARIIAWVGALSAIPALYIDHWLPYQAGGWTENPTYHAGILIWRIVSATTLAGYLWVDRRAPRGCVPDTQVASGFGVLAVLQTAWFGVWFVDNPPSYPMFSFLLLMLAVLLHTPSRWMVGAYLAAAPVALVGALVYGTAPAVVVEWTAPYVLSVVLVILVDRVVYQRAYQGFEAEHLLGRANADLEATLGELREAQGRLLDAERQAERTRISRDLHDSVGAQLSSLLAGIELARLRGEAPDGALGEVEADAREAMRQLRETVWVLNASEVTVEALAAQLRRFAEARARASGIHAAVQATGDRFAVVPSAAALQLYRVGQEAVQNAVKHSGASTISIRLASIDGRLALSVRDDGTFRPPITVTGDGAPSGFGMASMKERAAALGGSFALATEAGTEVAVEVPLGGA